jgi:three-Cys-motif partner protein
VRRFRCARGCPHLGGELSETFFNERQGAAIMKHAVLKRYLPWFAMKGGKFAPGRTVVYIDGYAGPGLYADGASGSPLIAADVAALIDTVRTVDATFVEKDADFAEQLRNTVALALPAAPVLQGTMSEHLDDILERAVAWSG